MNVWMRKVRVAVTPRNWLLKSRLSNGALVFGRNQAGYGGRGVYIFRDNIEPELDRLEELLTPSSVFVDVGANTGVYTLKAAKHLQAGGVVIAIEPFLDVLASLSYSVRVNGFQNVRLRNFCAGEATHAARLWTNFQKPNSFSLEKKDSSACPLSVMMVALDDLFEWEGLDRLDYLKIDAESSEPRVLAGAKRTIIRYRPIIQMEVSVKDLGFRFESYKAFQAFGSPNCIYIPDDHEKVKLPDQFGWRAIS